jgi:hypothetical protein
MRDYNPILDSVLSAVASALNEQGRPVGRTERTPGLLPAWDDCCAGQLYLRVIEIFPSGSPFPQFDVAQKGAAGAKCSIHLLAFRIGVGVLRCAATLDNKGKAPTPAAVSADQELAMDDMATLLDVLVCEVPDLQGIQALKMDRWQPQGTEGGCHGGEWGVYLAVNPCLCSPLPDLLD